MRISWSEDESKRGGEKREDSPRTRVNQPLPVLLDITLTRNDLFELGDRRRWGNGDG